MKKILVPTDFSETAEHALKVAAQLAKKHHSEIYLLHMLELPTQLVDPVGGSNSQNLPESLFFMKLAHQRFAEIMARPFLKDIKVHEINKANKTCLFPEARLPCCRSIKIPYDPRRFPAIRR